jgi:hypothetical protein
LPAGRLHELPEAQREVMLALIAAAAHTEAPLERARKMSPSEVWAPAAPSLKRLPIEAIPVLLGKRALAEARMMTVRQGLFEVSDRRLAPRALRWLAIDQKTGRPLPEGSQWRVLAWGGLEDCLVLDAAGRLVARCREWAAPRRDDVVAIRSAMGAQAAWESERRAQMAGRHAGFLAEHAEAVASAKGPNRWAEGAMERPAGPGGAAAAEVLLGGAVGTSIHEGAAGASDHEGLEDRLGGRPEGQPGVDPEAAEVWGGEFHTP